MSFDIIANQRRTPGFKSTIFVIPHEDVTTWPGFDAGTKKYTGDFTLAASKVWSKVAVSKVPGETSVAQEASGNADNPTNTETLTFFIPGIDATTSAKLDSMVGKDLVFLLPDAGNCAADEVLYQVVGTKCDGFELQHTHSNDGTKKGYTITAKGYNTGAPALYGGAIVL